MAARRAVFALALLAAAVLGHNVHTYPMGVYVTYGSGCHDVGIEFAPTPGPFLNVC